MAGWELALVIVALTFMVVNMVSLMVQVALLASWKDIIVKTNKMVAKWIDKTDKMMDEIFGDDEDTKL